MLPMKNAQEMWYVAVAVRLQYILSRGNIRLYTSLKINLSPPAISDGTKDKCRTCFAMALPICNLLPRLFDLALDDVVSLV